MGLISRVSSRTYRDTVKMLRLTRRISGFKNPYIQPKDRNKKVTFSDLENLRNSIPNVPVIDTPISDHGKRTGQPITDKPPQHLEAKHFAGVYRRNYLTRGPTTPYCNRL